MIRRHAPVPPLISEPAAPARRRRLERAGILAAVLVAEAIVAVATLWHRPAEQLTPRPHDSTNAKPVGPLDGTFTAENGPRTDIVGNAYQGNLVTQPYDGSWSIRSSCRANGCVATASFGRQNYKLSTLVFDDIDGLRLAALI